MDDVFTAIGESIIADMVASTNWYIGWGTGSGTATKDSADLFDPAGARILAINERPAPDTNRMRGRLTASTPLTITNSGLFNTPAIGGLFVHSSFEAIDLEPGESISFWFDIQWG